MTIRSLINDDGSPFQTEELDSLRKQLDSLSSEERTKYRNANASAISEHEAEKFLIVSGPGTGKSTLFLSRIINWFKKDEAASVFVTSFVRKLVADLQNDIDSDSNLTQPQKTKITASTPHRLARSIIEKNHGTAKWPFKPHFRLIAQLWKVIVWQDVLSLNPTLGNEDYSWKRFAIQLHKNEFEKSPEWKALTETYLTVCKIYNAAGFDDMILRAATALKERPTLIDFDHFIIDEYQDFNLGEQSLIEQLVSKSKSRLIVGDDEQVLYESLKAADPSLIRELYVNREYTKGGLPFCGRSSFHITKSAYGFIRQTEEEECIEKIYLPIKTDDVHPKVQVIACATPSTAADYILKFVTDHQSEIDDRKTKLENGGAKDAFLLILTPDRKIKFYKDEAEKIKDTAERYRGEIRTFSEDYYKLLSYYSLSKYSRDNFTFRKVLYYERVSNNAVRDLISTAIKNNVDFCDLDSKEVKLILSGCRLIRGILEDGTNLDEKIKVLSEYIDFDDCVKLKDDIQRRAIVKDDSLELGHDDDEDAELEEIEVKKMGAVELMSIVGAKGLSADHVIIIGFDDVNMNYVTKNAFYVAITRPRTGLHLVTALKSGGSKGASAYLDQLPVEHLEFHRYKKSGRETSSLADKSAFKGYLASLSNYRNRN